MKRYRLFGILLTVFIIGVLSGCGPGTSVDTQITLLPQATSLSSYESAINAYVLRATHRHPENLTVVYSKDFSGGYLSQFLFSLNSTRYEGDDYSIRTAGKWRVENITYSPIDTTVAFTRMELGGMGKRGKQYMIVSGVINNPRVSYVELSYIDGLLARVMKLSNKHGYSTYAFARTDSQIGLKSIVGYHSNGEKVYAIE